MTAATTTTAEPGTTSTVAIILGTERRPELIRWTTWWRSSAGSYDSYALVTPDGPVVIDPEALTVEGEERLLALQLTTTHGQTSVNGFGRVRYVRGCARWLGS